MDFSVSVEQEMMNLTYTFGTEENIPDNPEKGIAQS